MWNKGNRRVTPPLTVDLTILENKVARLKALPRIPKIDPPRRDRSPSNTKKGTRRRQEISPDRNGWDKKKQELIGTFQSRKRKRDQEPDLARDRKRSGSSRRRGARTPAL